VSKDLLSETRMYRRNFIMGLGGSLAATPAAPLARLIQLSSSAYDEENKDFGLPPASGIHPPPYALPTPLRVDRVTTITTRELKSMLDSNGNAVLIDCREVPTTCRGHPEEDCGGQTLSIPSALWFPGAGLGTAVDDELQKKFLGRIGRYCCDRGAPLVFFCYGKNSWLSINAAIRAASAGYRKVYWYRGGRSAWRAANLPITPVIFMGTLQPLPLPKSTFCDEGHEYGVAPVAGVIRTQNLEAATPTGVIGAETISTPRLWDMMLADEPPVLIDVLGGNQKMTLPGALWSPNTGRGVSLDDDVQQALSAEINRLTCNDKSVPVVLFCLSKTCWLSVNAVVRAVALEYQHVYWYRGGRCAWEAGGLPMGPVNLLSRASTGCCDPNANSLLHPRGKS
jgi:PQQ-dependent catabolism-associated CXXCW motif protein